jgi:DNA-binding PadR family transcriptional regulator
MSPYDPAAPLKPVHYLILVLLAEEPTYGAELMERLEMRSAAPIRLNAGSLYRTVASLVDEGLVRPLEERTGPVGGGAPRKIYGVSERGLEALRSEARRQASLLESVRALDLLEESS